jgi:hypothetical protein
MADGGDATATSTPASVPARAVLNRRRRENDVPGSDWSLHTLRSCCSDPHIAASPLARWLRDGRSAARHVEETAHIFRYLQAPRVDRLLLTATGHLPLVFEFLHPGSDGRKIVRGAKPIHSSSHCAWLRGSYGEAGRVQPIEVLRSPSTIPALYGVLHRAVVLEARWTRSCGHGLTTIGSPIFSLDGLFDLAHSPHRRIPCSRWGGAPQPAPLPVRSPACLSQEPASCSL